MTPKQFVDKYNGQFVEYHSYDPVAKNQCVDLANEWLDKGLGLKAIIGTNAIDFPSKAVANGMDWIPNTDDGIPEPGDLIVYAGKIGHIDIALEGCTKSKVVAFSQNYPTGSPCVVRSSSYLKPKVEGWIHPKGTMNADELHVCLKDRQKFWDERDSLLRELQAESVEGGLNTIRGLRARITDLTNQLGISQAEVKNKEEIISRRELELLNCQNDVKALLDRIEEAAKTVSQLGKDKGNLAIENEKLKIQLETAKQGEFTLTLAQLIKMLLTQKIVIKKG